MLSNKYIINFRRLVLWLLPRPLRKPKWIALLLSFIGPVIDLYNLFISFRDYVIYRLTITPQVCFLEKALNDRYDPTLRRIYIADANIYEYLYLYRRDEAKPKFFHRKTENKPVYLYTRAETAIFGVDFVINVPLLVPYNLNELTAMLNSYKLASKKFKVNIV